jgi:hypothetical protein
MIQNEPQPPTATPPPGDGWFVARGEERDGPMSLGALNSLVLTNEVKPATFVWRAGMAKWSAAANVDEIRAMFQSLTPLIVGPDGTMRFAAMTQMPESAVSVRAHAAFWLGIGSFVPGIGVAAIFCGFAALRSIRRTPGQTGKRRAIVGIVLGFLTTAASITLIALFAAGTIKL